MKSKFLNILSQRGFVQDCTNAESLDAYLANCEKDNRPAVAYIGFDCTASSLHVGSLLQIMALRHFQKSGHKPIILLGGATTKIGDPSGKDESRKILDEQAISNNKKGIKKIFDKYIEFEESFDPKTNKAMIVDNDEWLAGKGYIDFLREVGPHFSINRMLTFESVKRRLEREQTLSFLEFNYMILQAYDFTVLSDKYDCRIQIGGSDQWGNIVNGTELNRRLGNKNELFGLTTPLLTTASGAKMGKTANGAVWLDEEYLKPYDFWQFWRNVEDADIVRFCKYFTELTVDEIEEISQLEGAEINNAKIRLANEVTSLCHSKQAAEEAEETAKKVFEQGGVGGDLPEFEISREDLNNGLDVVEIFKIAGFCQSNGEFKRLVKGGGAKVNDQKVNSLDQQINTQDLVDIENYIKISSGKKKHAIIKAV
jgi:tyrosyl-tRNA synthetase